MPPAEDAFISTIGYGQDVYEPFLVRLRRIPGVTHVVDVRTNPYSRYQEDFRSDFGPRLQRDGLKYVFMGDRLGAKPSHPEVLTEGEPDVTKMRAWPFFLEGIERLIEAAQAGKQLCLLCGCARPDQCHRGTFLGEVLLERGIDLAHYLTDGQIIRQSEMRLHFPPEQLNLFT